MRARRVLAVNYAPSVGGKLIQQPQKQPSQQEVQQRLLRNPANPPKAARYLRPMKGFQPLLLWFPSTDVAAHVHADPEYALQVDADRRSANPGALLKRPRWCTAAVVGQ